MLASAERFSMRRPRVHSGLVNWVVPGAELAGRETAKLAPAPCPWSDARNMRRPSGSVQTRTYERPLAAAARGGRLQAVRALRAHAPNLAEGRHRVLVEKRKA